MISRRVLCEAAAVVVGRAFRSSSMLALAPHYRDVIHVRFRPHSRLSVSEWADKYRVLSPETSAEPGQWRTSRVPYLKGIMDAISDPMVERVINIKAAQVGFTEVTLNAVGYFVDQDPASILVIQPNVDPMAKYWSKSRLAPMVRDSHQLRGKVKSPQSRHSGNTILDKSFPGGEISIAGANSAASLASRPIRVLILDEVDKFNLVGGGTEADPVQLAETRTDTFWNRKIILGSTPENKGESIVEKEWERPEVDQYHYFVGCPHCGYMQTLKWHNLKWEDGRPDTAMYTCGDVSKDGELVAGCGQLIGENHKQRMLRGGEWRITRPASSPMKRRRVGFRINGLYSPFRHWDELAHLWLGAQGDTKLLKQFVNERLGETWEVPGEKVSPEDLEKRAEVYGAEVPAGVGILTAGVDVQGNRLEVAIKGWGDKQESWLIAHHRIFGDPEAQETWARLDTLLLTKTYKHECGADLRIQACMIDSGYKTSTVYDFARSRQSRNVFASKGVHERGRPPLQRSQRANKSGVKLFTIGTVAMKDRMFGRLKLERPGPGYMHFCMPGNDGADAEYFAQFGAEHSVVERAGHRWVRRYKQVRERNEAIDLEVLALAALYALGAGVAEHLDVWVKRVIVAGEEAKNPPARVAVTRDRRSSWVNRWRD